MIGNLFSKKPALELMRTILNHWEGSNSSRYLHRGEQFDLVYCNIDA